LNNCSMKHMKHSNIKILQYMITITQLS